MGLGRAEICAGKVVGLGSEQHLGDAVQSSECARAAGGSGGVVSDLLPLPPAPDRGRDPLPPVAAWQWMDHLFQVTR